MSVVKIGNKSILENLQAKLTLRIGRKLNQQEILDLCVQYSLLNIDGLLQLLSQQPTLNIAKAQQIIARRNSRANIPYNQDEIFPNVDDQDIYSN